MTADEARDVILFEGWPDLREEAMFVMVRMGDDPGSQRMQRLLEAMNLTHKSLRGQQSIDRKLAGALWLLGDTLLTNYQSWAAQGRKWRDDFEQEILEVFDLCEAIFLDSGSSAS